MVHLLSRSRYGENRSQDRGDYTESGPPKREKIMHVHSRIAMP